MRRKTGGDLLLPASPCVAFSVSHSFTESWSVYQEKVDQRYTSCKIRLFKAYKRCSQWPICAPQTKSLLSLFFIARIYDWSSHLIYHEWGCVPIDSLAPCLLSGVCNQRSDRPLSGATAYPHKFTKVPVFHQAQSVQITHTHSHIYAEVPDEWWWARRDFPQAVLAPQQQDTLMMSHFNDVTYADLCLEPIPCLSGRLHWLRVHTLMGLKLCWLSGFRYSILLNLRARRHHRCVVEMKCN